MEFNNKKLQRTSKFVNYFIAIILCGFLISLSNRLIDDVDQWKERPQVIEFEDKEILKQYQTSINTFDAEINQKREKASSIQNTINIANANYLNEKESFDNWLRARKTVGSPKKDNEVLKRANKLDEYYKSEQDWNAELALLQTSIKQIQQSKNEINEEINKERSLAYESQRIANRQYNLKIFLIRLMFILPILLLAIFFIMRFRKHKYWPLFLGFILFAFYAFFLGLVPYMPDYGGYIRYSVGIILSILLGVYTINKIRSFIERKKNELKVSTTERAKHVQKDTAEKALDNHMCPSCGKDFIVKKWNKPPVKKEKQPLYGVVTNFCRFCGLELFKKCKSCGTENFAHLPFCANCGDNTSE